jgi:hypothetical protein
MEQIMGAAFYSPGTVHIRQILHKFFDKNNIKNTATNFRSLFDPANSYDISQAIVAMDLPPRNGAFGAKLQQRFALLFDNMLKSDNSNGTTTHNDVRQAVFDVLGDALTANPVKPIKFYVAHQDDAGPFSPAKPEFRFVQWREDDDSNKPAFNFLLICPELPGPVATRLQKAVAKKVASKGANQKPKRRRGKK